MSHPQDDPTDPKSERFAELMNLPDHVMKWRGDAFFVEVAHHIGVGTGGYDITALNDGDQSELLMMVYEERDKAPESTLFGIAMRAFTRYYDENGGEDEFWFPSTSLDDWR